MDFPIFEKIIQWDGRAFKKMKNLKTLIIKNADFSQGAKHLPNSLRVLEWQEYPSHFLPPDFHPEGLAVFKLPNSSLMSIMFLQKRKASLIISFPCFIYIKFILKLFKYIFFWTVHEFDSFKT